MRFLKYFFKILSYGSARFSVPLFEYSERDPLSAAVVTEEDSASIAYLIRPYLSRNGFATSIVTWAGQVEKIQCGIVVISRYLADGWEKELRKFSQSGGTVIYFMDDDLFDANALQDLPVKYAKKILRLAGNKRAVIEDICDEFWVSSNYLLEKYRVLSPKLLAPLDSVEDQKAKEVCTFCYHGTASHKAEIDWLFEIVSAVQRSQDLTHFEIFGDHTINRSYRRIPRTSVLHPMSWPSYLAYTSRVSCQISLAPLLPNLFNAARGPTKFFDFTRMDAVGIYTDAEPYRSFVRNGIDGILLPNVQELWVSAIIELASDSKKRSRMLAAAKERLLSHEIFL